MFILVNSIVIFLLTCAYLLWRRYVLVMLKGLESLKGPKNVPFFGGLLEFLPPSESLWKNGEKCKLYGNTYKIAIPFTVGIITKDPDFIEYIVTSQKTINKGMIYMVLKEWLGDGLLLSGSAKWRSRRKLLTPAFHFNILKQFQLVFNKNNDILAKQMRNAAAKNGGDIDISHYVTLAALDNIVESTMGTSINCQLNEDSDFIWATKFMTPHVFNRVFNPLTYYPFTYIFTSRYWTERKALRILKKFTMDLIKARRESLRTNPIPDNLNTNTNSDDESVGIKKKTAFLDLLLSSTIDGKPLSDADITEEVDTFMFEGHDTISAGITFTLFCIAQHPDIQAKIIEEQRSIFGSTPQREVTMEDLNEMTYLEMVLKEGLRLYPSVPSIVRNAGEDFQFKDFTCRKGVNIVILIYYVHRDPEIYPNPEEFIPERFLPSEQAKRHPFAYLPFSAGHRNCIGQRFAMMELKSTISKVLREFVVTTTKPPFKCKLPASIVLNSSNGAFVNITPRQW